MIFDRTAERLGITNGEITRQQFTGAAQQFMATRSSSSSSDADRRFRERDRNGDGLLNYDEMSDTLQEERDRWDTNRDGFIDLNEYRTYMEARAQQRELERAAEQDGRDGRPDYLPWLPLPEVPEEEEKKPPVYRAGKLPQEIPQWFKDYDTDGDAQIGVYEWKTTGRPFDEFNGLDRNGDGFVTIDETLYFVAQQKNNGSPGERVASRGGDSRGGDNRGSSSSSRGPGGGPSGSSFFRRDGGSGGGPGSSGGPPGGSFFRRDGGSSSPGGGPPGGSFFRRDGGSSSGSGPGGPPRGPGGPGGFGGSFGGRGR
jgi:Ca2+-binding EF-hand superfamily protein